MEVRWNIYILIFLTIDSDISVKDQLNISSINTQKKERLCILIEMINISIPINEKGHKGVSGMECNISINILNYNTYEKSKRCIRSCQKQIGYNYKIVLIDNHSTDDSFQKLKNEFGDNVIYIENNENYGYAKGNNIGVKWSIDNGFQYSLLLNSDTELSTDIVLQRLVKTIKSNKNTYVVAPLIYNVTSSGLELNKNDSAYLKILRFFQIIPKNKKITNQLETVSEAQGSALLVNNKAFISVGGFPEHYFMYGEEGTFAKKILWSGGSILWMKDVKNFIYHHHDKSEKIDSWRLYLMGRNRAIEYYENRRSLSWLIAYRLSFIMQKIRHNDIFVQGALHGEKLIVENHSKTEIYIDGKETVERIGI